MIYIVCMRTQSIVVGLCLFVFMSADVCLFMFMFVCYQSMFVCLCVCLFFFVHCCLIMFFVVSESCCVFMIFVVVRRRVFGLFLFVCSHSIYVCFCLLFFRKLLIAYV